MGSSSSATWSGSHQDRSGVYRFNTPAQAWDERTVASPIVFDELDVIAHELRQHPSLTHQRPIARAIIAGAESLGHDPFLVLATMEVESRFDPDAVSPKGARGLMQVMPSTEAWIRDRYPEALERLDPGQTDAVHENVRLGIVYLNYLLRRYHGRVDLALTAYNRGPGATDALLQAHGEIPEPVNEFYSDRVIRTYLRYLRQYPSNRLPMP